MTGSDARLFFPWSFINRKVAYLILHAAVTLNVSRNDMKDIQEEK